MQNKLKVVNNVTLDKSKINQNVKISHLREIENPPISSFIRREKNFPLLTRKRGKERSTLGKRLGLKSAFTLVELMVIITILTILATISFISFQGFTTDARDVKRITDI
ncbi:MAG: type II secretion system GspH family protein [Candidatus Peribacteria bacterium]|jgi:hypothetical protein|nr:type II secretion system GspH family protein [Candidatus Peribacteria bacterium]